MSSFTAVDAGMLSLGLLLARLVLGGLMLGHGAQKLLGWFGGHGLAATGGFFESLGFRPGRFLAATAAATEITSGLLLALGLLTPVAAAMMLSVMIVAAGSVHWKNGLFAASNGIEVPLLYGVGALALGLTGSGAYSLDTALGLSAIWSPAVTWALLGLGVAGGLGNLLLRRPAPVAAASPEAA
jgi:putative oxidoreductase